MSIPLELPLRFRPDVPYKKCVPGTDLPEWFLTDLKAIDANIWPIWHPWRILWDDTINADEGPADNPRFTVHGDGEHLIMGFVMTDSEGRSISENEWHLYRLSQYGWNHIFNVASTDGLHLTKILDNLYLQALISTKGKRAWSRHLQAKELQNQARDEANARDRFEGIQDQNKWLMRKGLEEAERGNINPTNPVKEIITSYRGQKSKSKIVRPLTDKEGGIYIPD